VCDLHVMGVPSKLSAIRKAAAIARARPTLFLSWAKKWVSVRFSLRQSFLYLYLYTYYESTKRKVKTKYICECRCYERLQTKTKEFTRLSYTEMVLELEHLTIEMRLITEMFVNVMGECEK
jgi:hypothetical protein